ncbi:phage tail protein [Roseateles koreensis]|uniref:Tail fiber protein n=1 Tax=Roseateles koreensis TaxID=2987526 RepID=A0ABT5KVW0_9BURK|nr:tail fiber protein [Roseateles koreensis]MDC8787074.1 tail fiber protein [Roseateles koreensis]
MSEPYVGEIRLFAGSFAPVGWYFCNGALLPISEFDTLFNLIGTTYGGDGQSTFALPDLQGRVPVHQGSGHVMGERAGVEAVTLSVSQMPMHTHTPQGSSTTAIAGSPGGNVLAAPPINSYGPGPATVAMADAAIAVQGGSQPHNNMAPFTTLNYIISLFGVYPSQN